jgi:hypothetical protein
MNLVEQEMSRYLESLRCQQIGIVSAEIAAILISHHAPLFTVLGGPAVQADRKLTGSVLLLAEGSSNTIFGALCVPHTNTHGLFSHEDRPENEINTSRNRLVDPYPNFD